MLNAECCYVDCCYAECHYAECRYAECHYAEYHYAECRYSECRGAPFKQAEVISAVSPGLSMGNLSPFALALLLNDRLGP
jgi:hypothetical protein